jgi:mannose-6-phosphate isomerase-like protein (cupin superfamily)
VPAELSLAMRPMGARSESGRRECVGPHSVAAMTRSLIIHSNGGTSFEDGPDRGRVLIAGESTDNAYSLMELTVAPREPDVGFGPHLHLDINEVFVVRKGTLEFLLGSDVTSLIAGDVVRLPPGVRHGYRNASGEPVELLVWFTPGSQQPGERSRIEPRATAA